ncbi:MAG: anthranilate phosphoribosyltransferase [Alphaproteobacteria bacterium]|nr:anthranilate phosphoribosyltransferase [Alphaproteobacteria bacterium]
MSKDNVIPGPGSAANANVSGAGKPASAASSSPSPSGAAAPAAPGGAGLRPFLATVAEGKPLSAAEAEKAFDIIMSGDATPAQIGAFLMALRVRGETVDEIAGAARVMRAKARHVKAPDGAIDTVGTGGDSAGTFNVSTATAIVLAGCGVAVAKHGNRAVSSKAGSADTLAALGVNLDADYPLVEAALAESGLCFMLAPRYHSAMRNVGPARVEMGVRTIFNLLGPISNPALVTRQLVGVFDRRWVVPVAEVLKALGSVHAWVVHGSDGLDEVTLTGPTHVAELKDGKVREFEVTPEDAGLPRQSAAALKGGDGAENAATMRHLLAGKQGPLRDFVLLNAAAALIVAGKSGELKQGVLRAAEAIDSGKALAALEKLIAVTNR